MSLHERHDRRERNEAQPHAHYHSHEPRVRHPSDDSRSSTVRFDASLEAGDAAAAAPGGVGLQRETIRPLDETPAQYLPPPKARRVDQQSRRDHFTNAIEYDGRR